MASWSGNPMKDPGRYITKGKLTTLLGACRNPRNQLLILMLNRTGRRISELLELKPEHINVEEKTIRWKILKKKRPLNRAKPVDDDTLTYLLRYIAENRIPPEGKVFTISRQRVWQIFKKLSDDTGIVCENGDSFSPHVLRHTHAVEMSEACENPHDMILLSQDLEHSSPNITFKYLDVHQSGVRKLLDKTYKKSEEDGTK